MYLARRVRFCVYRVSGLARRVPSGAAGSCLRSEDQYVPHPHPREVISCRATDNTAANDDDPGVSGKGHHSARIRRISPGSSRQREQETHTMAIPSSRTPLRRRSCETVPQTVVRRDQLEHRPAKAMQRDRLERRRRQRDLIDVTGGVQSASALPIAVAIATPRPL